jgi:hypothetical protein
VCGQKSGTRRIRVYGFGVAARVVTVPHQNCATPEPFPARSTPRSQNQTQMCSHVTWGEQKKSLKLISDSGSNMVQARSPTMSFWRVNLRTGFIALRIWAAIQLILAQVPTFCCSFWLSTTVWSLDCWPWSLDSCWRSSLFHAIEALATPSCLCRWANAYIEAISTSYCTCACFWNWSPADLFWRAPLGTVDCWLCQIFIRSLGTVLPSFRV